MRFHSTVFVVVALFDVPVIEAYSTAILLPPLEDAQTPTVPWDETLVDAVCGPHNIPLTALPEIKASSEVYATLKKESTGIEKLEGVPVSAILGDQQAALCK